MYANDFNNSIMLVSSMLPSVAILLSDSTAPHVGSG